VKPLIAIDIDYCPPMSFLELEMSRERARLPKCMHERHGCWVMRMSLTAGKGWDNLTGFGAPNRMEFIEAAAE
jgi:hypothetical protein